MSARKIICFPQGIIDAVKKYRFDSKIETESEAYRTLVKAGLEAEAAKGNAHVGA
ncbi:hypothetical protein [Azospirillum doebereinerae]|uniref:hypothetical protein n=1 Tax=Azospirillum doebereinerae TaxID=92933 RepID=UPI00163CCCD1|nr:hypothetical protein [Azospirillum doebereinerae]